MIAAAGLTWADVIAARIAHTQAGGDDKGEVVL